MLKKINVKGVASYDESGIELNLKNINYIFGSNGTGKTTISEFLRSNKDDKFSACEMNWLGQSPATDLYVYNKYFVEENFNIQNEIKGIFTLGKESSELVGLIEENTKKVEDYREKIEGLQINIDEKEEEVDNLKDGFTDQSWGLKQKFDVNFKDAFTGVRSNKEKFMKKCLEQAKNNIGELFTFEELTERVESVFNSSKEKMKPLPNIEYNKSVEDQSIFQIKIIGKDDIDIATLINRLNISDWVQHGHRHMEESNGVCPFCQRILSEEFKMKLDKYFDETYANQIEELKASSEKYKAEIDDILKKYQPLLLDTDTEYIDKEKVASIIEVINSTYNENILLLNKKINEPSISIGLSTVVTYIEQLNIEIARANRQILELNRVIDNLKDEETKLINDIWKFIVEENKNNYETYKSGLDRLNKALEGMKGRKKNQTQYKSNLEGEIIKHQRQLTSVVSSIDEINLLLKSFGFTNFELAEAEQEGNYKIIREDGEDANETLSEGEKTFISFLYFYQLINGSNEQDNINTPRVIVIDDPISSLDSNVLFMVSNLINDLKIKIRSNDSNFRQLILLTHNVYFHKEVSFNKRQQDQRL